MNGRLIGILFGSGIGVIAGLFLTYLGFLSPVFRKSSEQLAPDRWVGAFRILMRIAGPVLCLVAGLKIYSDIRQESAGGIVPVSRWREFTSSDGRFRVSAPDGFAKNEVKDVPDATGRVSESFFGVKLPRMGFLVSYADLPQHDEKLEPEKILDAELDASIQASRVEVRDRKSTQFVGYPAIRFKLHDLQKGLFVDCIFLLAKERRYQLAFQFTSESLEQYAEPFFNSFHLLDGP